MTLPNYESLIVNIGIGLAASLTVFSASWLIYRRQRKHSEYERERVLKQVEELKFALEKTTAAQTSEKKPGFTVPLEGDKQREGAIPKVPSELVSAFASQGCILFAGGGIAAQAGLPTWSLGLRLILDRAAKLDPSQNWDPLRRGLDSGELSSVSELIRDRLPGEALAQICEEVFGGTNMQTSRMHSVLSDLPFTGVLTTSWDRTLDVAYQGRHPVILSPTSSHQLGEIVREKRFFLLKLYGDPNNPSEFLFTPEEYNRATYENELFSRFVNSMYVSNTIIFAGASLQGIEYFLHGLRIRRDQSRTHFALVPKQEGMEIEAERFQSRYGVQLLNYEPTPGFPEPVQFFEQLRERVRARPVSLPPNEIVSVSIDRLRLENIGSFESLDLAFNGNWNVLLGNNGCGKSTILKAIALGLCGDDIKARDAAANLLRSQADRGVIEIWVGQQKYTTSLFRSGREVNVKCEQVTPLQAGRWVVLGFPPLRGVSLQKPKGPSGSDGSPNPEVPDLLPLISGGVDTRLDSLKQWIINIFLRSEPGNKSSTADRTRSVQLLNSFFDLLGQLTPGVSCKFMDIDRTSWQIIVRTPDGDVPIDSISQGTASVYGWIGTLLQRMYEIYRNSTEPEKQPALVLVDEIDAHMHPEWQQMIVPLVQRKFPRLQVIATTHSPLIVGGMPVDQITRFVRDESGKVVIAKIDDDMTLGRTDQILTGDLFGLESTLSLGQEGDKAMAEYEQLLAISSRTTEQEKRYVELYKILELRLPAAGAETKLERRTQALVDAVLSADYSAKNVEALKKKLLSKTREVAKSMGWKELQ